MTIEANAPPKMAANQAVFLDHLSHIADNH